MPEFREVANVRFWCWRIIIHIKTAASGVNNPAQGFQFIVMPDLEYDIVDSIEFALPNYQSGTFELVTLVGLKEMSKLFIQYYCYEYLWNIRCSKFTSG